MKEPRDSCGSNEHKRRRKKDRQSLFRRAITRPPPRSEDREKRADANVAHLRQLRPRLQRQNRGPRRLRVDRANIGDERPQRARRRKSRKGIRPHDQASRILRDVTTFQRRRKIGDRRRSRRRLFFEEIQTLERPHGDKSRQGVEARLELGVGERVDLLARYVKNIERPLPLFRRPRRLCHTLRNRVERRQERLPIWNRNRADFRLKPRERVRKSLHRDDLIGPDVRNPRRDVVDDKRLHFRKLFSKLSRLLRVLRKNARVQRRAL